MKTVITEELYNYTLQHGTKTHPVVEELIKHNQSLPNGFMQTSPEQMQLMVIIAKLMNARKYLEIGSFTGYSAMNMALGVGKHLHITTIDNNIDNLNTAKYFWKKAGIDEQIQAHHKDALVVLEKLCNNKPQELFDISFIDANKSQYLKYFNYCYELTRPSGVIIIDNVLMHGLVLDANNPKLPNYVSAIHNFNQTLINDNRVEIVMLPFADGLTLAYKKFTNFITN